MRALPRWLTTDSAQRLTGLSAARLYQLKRAGQVRATRRPDGTNRYHRDSLREYVESEPEKQGRRRCGWHPERLTEVVLPAGPDNEPPWPLPAAPLALLPPAVPEPTEAACRMRQAASVLSSRSPEGEPYERS